MADAPLDFTFKKVDAKDTTWYARRELGHPDDPYNKDCKKLNKDDPQYSEWLKIGADLTNQLEKDILQDEGDGWVLLGDKDVCNFFFFFFFFFFVVVVVNVVFVFFLFSE